jgi:mono/diheme cytochrome c family protein
LENYIPLKWVNLSRILFEPSIYIVKNFKIRYMLKKLSLSLFFSVLFVLFFVSQASNYLKPLSTGFKPSNGAQESSTKAGENLYIKHCLQCHQKDGSGVPNMFPPILKSDWVTGDKIKLINVLLKGLRGDIEVSGDLYSQVMPKQDYLTNAEIAQILTYIRQNFGNDASAIYPDDVTAVRGKN